MSTLPERLRTLRTGIFEAAVRSHRSPEGITLIAVSKGQPPECLQEAVAAGVTVFGENYVQEWLEHRRCLSSDAIDWHFIGSLQSRKARQVVGSVSLIHTVDSLRLAEEIDKRAALKKITQDILLEVNVGGETSKHGLSAEDVPAMAGALNALKHTRLRGLMTLPPFFEDPECVRPYFRALRELRDAIEEKNVYKAPIPELSMGMSHDYKVAIEEGATFVRLGTALLGPR